MNQHSQKQEQQHSKRGSSDPIAAGDCVPAHTPLLEGGETPAVASNRSGSGVLSSPSPVSAPGEEIPEGRNTVEEMGPSPKMKMPTSRSNTKNVVARNRGGGGGGCAGGGTIASVFNDTNAVGAGTGGVGKDSNNATAAGANMKTTIADGVNNNKRLLAMRRGVVVGEEGGECSSTGLATTKKQRRGLPRLGDIDALRHSLGFLKAGDLARFARASAAACEVVSSHAALEICDRFSDLRLGVRESAFSYPHAPPRRLAFGVPPPPNTDAHLAAGNINNSIITNGSVNNAVHSDGGGHLPAVPYASGSNAPHGDGGGNSPAVPYPNYNNNPQQQHQHHLEQQHQQQQQGGGSGDSGSGGGGGAIQHSALWDREVVVSSSSSSSPYGGGSSSGR